jgi:hypothetical protein
MESIEVEAGALYTSYFSSIEEVVEHVRAAETLGLGFRVESYMVTSPDEPRGEFEFTLFGDIPTRAEGEA